MVESVDIKLFTYKHLLLGEMFKTKDQLTFFVWQPEQRLVYSN